MLKMEKRKFQIVLEVLSEVLGAFLDTENFEEKQLEEIWSCERKGNLLLEKVIYFFVVSLKMAVFKASL